MKLYIRHTDRYYASLNKSPATTKMRKPYVGLRGFAARNPIWFHDLDDMIKYLVVYYPEYEIEIETASFS
jgi:hypothetical protein